MKFSVLDESFYSVSLDPCEQGQGTRLGEAPVYWAYKRKIGYGYRGIILALKGFVLAKILEYKVGLRLKFKLLSAP